MAEADAQVAEADAEEPVVLAEPGARCHPRVSSVARRARKPATGPLAAHDDLTYDVI
ncbi:MULTISPECIES: hypothetical protein [Pseudofrankia]|uniref:hypothetical protein n=1 Tax=Pseudofrankia TaxID=2994363 RepID=UPI0012FF480A|nr:MULTISPECIES: hypothetical protein [Pseudofrankia]